MRKYLFTFKMKCFPKKVWPMTCDIFFGTRPERKGLMYCDYIRQFSRRYSKYVRVPVRVHAPIKGREVKPRESLRELPKPKKLFKTEFTSQAEITSSELFRSIMGEIHTSKSRKLIAIEGGNLLEDAIKFGLNMRYLFMLKTLKPLPDSIQNIVKDIEMHQKESHSCNNFKPEIHKIPLKTLEEWSSLTTPPGLIGIFEKPSSDFKPLLESSHGSQTVPLTIVLDNIREPGNLGSILRTAAGIGCKAVLSNGCTDPWETKALRGGNGAQFFVPLKVNVDLSSFYQIVPLADLQSSYSTHPNESSTLPNPKSGIGIFLADCESSKDNFGLPIVPYTSVNYSKLKSIYLCIGGETHGLSRSLKKAVADLKDVYPDDIEVISRVTIPMHFPIDSLNAANAVGIIGYEIARQYSQSVNVHVI